MSEQIPLFSAQQLVVASLPKRRINDSVFDYYKRLQRVRRYVDRNHCEPISLADAADVAAMEKKSFSAFFRTKTGVCFRDWLADIRVAHAVELMQTRNLTITAVAYEVGFQELRTFERVFKKRVGCTPRDFKNTVRPS